MKNSISFNGISTKLGSFFHRYGVFVFFLVVTSSLITAMFMLNLVIIKTDNSEGYVSDVNNMSFDKETINKLRELRTADQDTKKIEANSGRILPF